MSTFAVAGISLPVPVGWEARGSAPTSDGHAERTFSVVHLATFPLSAPRAEFGGGAVESMRDDDAFVALVEYTPASAGTPLFARHGVPSRLRAASFSSGGLQRMIRGQRGLQRFFHVAGRAFCLYVVLGGQSALTRPLGEVNQILDGLVVRASPGA